MKKFPNLFVVSVTGNIAAGKTTLIEALKSDFCLNNSLMYPIFAPEVHELPNSQSAQAAPAYFAVSRSEPRVKINDPNAEDCAELTFQLAVLADLHTELERLNAEAATQNRFRLVIIERGWADVAIFAELLFGKASRNTITIENQIAVLFGELADLTICIHSPNYAENLARAQKRAKQDAAQSPTIGKFGDLAVFGTLEALYQKRFGVLPHDAKAGSVLGCLSGAVSPANIANLIADAFCNEIHLQGQKASLIEYQAKQDAARALFATKQEISLWDRIGVEVRNFSTSASISAYQTMQDFADDFLGILHKFQEKFHKQIAFYIEDIRVRSKVTGFTIESALHDLDNPPANADTIISKALISGLVGKSACSPIYVSFFLVDVDKKEEYSYSHSVAFWIGEDTNLYIFTSDVWGEREFKEYQKEQQAATK